MRTYKANLPEGVKKAFGAVRGVKIKRVKKIVNNIQCLFCFFLLYYLI